MTGKFTFARTVRGHYDRAVVCYDFDQCFIRIGGSDLNPAFLTVERLGLEETRPTRGAEGQKLPLPIRTNS